MGLGFMDKVYGYGLGFVVGVWDLGVGFRVQGFGFSV